MKKIAIFLTLCSLSFSMELELSASFVPGSFIRYDITNTIYTEDIENKRSIFGTQTNSNNPFNNQQSDFFGEEDKQNDFNPSLDRIDTLSETTGFKLSLPDSDRIILANIVGTDFLINRELFQKLKPEHFSYLLGTEVNKIPSFEELENIYNQVNDKIEEDLSSNLFLVLESGEAVFSSKAINILFGTNLSDEDLKELLETDRHLLQKENGKIQMPKLLTQSQISIHAITFEEELESVRHIKRFINIDTRVFSFFNIAFNFEVTNGYYLGLASGYYLLYDSLGITSTNSSFSHFIPLLISYKYRVHSSKVSNFYYSIKGGPFFSVNPSPTNTNTIKYKNSILSWIVQSGIGVESGGYKIEFGHCFIIRNILSEITLFGNVDEYHSATQLLLLSIDTRERSFSTISHSFYFSIGYSFSF